MPGHRLSSSEVAHAAGEKFIAIADILAFLKRYMLLIAAFFLAGGFLAAFYAISSDPIYTARTQILIEPKLPQYLQQQSGVAASLDTAQVESQIAVMRSEKIAVMVIDELGLMDNPVFFRLDGLSILDRVARFASALTRMLGLDPATRPAFLAWVDGIEAAKPTNQELTEFERTRHAIALFHAGMEVRRVGVSYAVDIYFRSHDPELAAAIANATATMFVREQMEEKAAAARAGGEWLEQRMGEMRSRMNHATQVAQEFRARHDYRVRASDARDVETDGATTLEELEVTADTYRQMYESFLIAYTNNVSNQSYPVADARVITAATKPLYASHPRKKLILAFGLLTGLMTGAGVALLNTLLDRTLRSPRQIGEELGLRCLGELPPQPGRNDGFGSLDAVVATPLTWFSECLRRAKAALGTGSSPLRCIGVTSALAHEGKETVACNLALLYASAGLRTVLVDADVDERQLSRKILGGREAARGGDRHQRCTPAQGDLVRNAFGEVDLIPANLSRPLEGASLPDLSEYEMVVVNLPPLAAGADQLRVAAALDGNLLVSEWGRTPLDLVRELITTLQAHDAPILGLMLTKVKSLSTKPYTGEEHSWPRIGSRRRHLGAPFRRPAG